MRPAIDLLALRARSRELNPKRIPKISTPETFAILSHASIRISPGLRMANRMS
ncbi:hypothetical protein KAX17_14230 [Candidatus Bipolaricaulota bacterium]|nr:hypothetical protein [Candidatus Bipolaricaulota bacterium]